MAKKSNVNFNDLSTWTLPIVLIVSAVIIGGLFFLMKMVLVEDVTKEIKAKEGNIRKEEQTYAKNTKILAILPKLRKEIEALEKVRDEAKAYLPTDVSMPSLIDNVYVAARKNGIVFNSFVTENKADEKFYTIQPISLSAKVGYVSMSSFIEEVTTLKRIMNVQNVSFKSNNQQQKNANEPLVMTAKLTTYIFKDSEQ